MKHLSTIPICSNTIFIYKLDIKDNLVLKFKKEKFKVALDTSGFFSKSSLELGEDLNILKKYKKLNKEIKKAVDVTVNEILMLKNIKYRIFSSWLTKTEPKGFSHSHDHTNSWLSGVYYPKGDPDFRVKFFNDTMTQFSTPSTESNIHNSREWIITPTDNFLILFFSQLRHKIMPNQSTEDRFSLAFNLLPQGGFGKGDSRIIF
tara:strand:- start:70 stop:681 length:612 start_codon:yes stop_codon:yes gene_type:complete